MSLLDEDEAQPAALQLEPPIDWWSLTAPERTQSLAVLRDFTVALVTRYGLSGGTVPPCWYLHEAIVQELLALYQYRNQQQFLEVAPPGAPLEFHYQFALARRRLQDWVEETGCTLSTHADTEIPGWVTAGTASADQFETAFERHATTLMTPDRSPIEGDPL